MQGTSLISAWSATGFVVSGVACARIISTSSLNIKSLATSAARFGLDCESFEMISTSYVFPLLESPEEKTFCIAPTT